MTNEQAQQIIDAINGFRTQLDMLMSAVRTHRPDGRQTQKQFLIEVLGDGAWHKARHIKAKALQQGFKMTSLSSFAANSKMVIKNEGRWKLAPEYITQAKAPTIIAPSEPKAPSPKFETRDENNNPISRMSPVEFWGENVAPVDIIDQSTIYQMCEPKGIAIEHVLKLMPYSHEYDSDDKNYYHHKLKHRSGMPVDDLIDRFILPKYPSPTRKQLQLFALAFDHEGVSLLEIIRILTKFRNYTQDPDNEVFHRNPPIDK